MRLLKEDLNMRDIISEVFIILAMLAAIAFFVLTGLCFVFGVVAFTETIATILAVLAGLPLVAIIVSSEIER